MKIASSLPLNPEAITADRDQDPPRVQIRSGSIRLMLTPAETVTLATRLVDVVAELRQLPTNQPKGTAP